MTNTKGSYFGGDEFYFYEGKVDTKEEAAGLVKVLKSCSPCKTRIKGTWKYGYVVYATAGEYNAKDLEVKYNAKSF